MLTWEQLDVCQTSYEIAELLKANGIKGNQRCEKSCPLAVATGWCVGRLARFEKNDASLTDASLTDAETDFVQRFDDGEFPFLEVIE